MNEHAVVLVGARPAGLMLGEAAEHIATRVAGPDNLGLATRLEKVTGATIAELARLAADWPDA